jgi:LuxR family transcriptional regulator, maltose regulon positive regulatory protein
MYIRTNKALLLLKIIPPKLGRIHLNRDRLSMEEIESSGSQITNVVAPIGYGKTSLMLEWRKKVLAKGGLAFWLSVDQNDEPMRFVESMTFAANQISGNNGFDDEFCLSIYQLTNWQEAITLWLAEVAELSVPTLLLIDEVSKLPIQTNQTVLRFLFENAPANLHIIFATGPCPIMQTKGNYNTMHVNRISADELRFHLEESMTILTNATKSTCTPENAIALHNLTEGWPFGLQLICSALRRTGNLDGGLLTAATSDIRRYFTTEIINSLGPNTRKLLTYISSFELVHPDLCVEVFNKTDVEKELAILGEDNPFLISIENSEWLKMHAFAKDIVQEYYRKLPLDERQEVARKASLWYVKRELYEEAAQQAFLAGNVAQSFELIESTTYEMTTQGKSDAVLAWYKRLPQNTFEEHHGFWAPTAWALAMSKNNHQSQPIVKLIMSHDKSTPADKFEASLIEATANGFADKLDCIRDKFHYWKNIPDDINQSLLVILAICKASVQLHQGEQSQARLILPSRNDIQGEYNYSPVAFSFVDYQIGLSHIKEGRFSIACQELKQSLYRAENEMGRDNALSCMLAALYFQSSWEENIENNSFSLFVGRLPILNKNGLPDAIISAYITLSHMADAQGHQDQAFVYLDSLDSIGESRSIERLSIIAYRERIKLHVKYHRVETAHKIFDDFERLIVRVKNASHPDSLFISWYELYRIMAKANILLCGPSSDQFSKALTYAERAIEIAKSLKSGVDEIEAHELRANALAALHHDTANEAFAELVSLTKSHGMNRRLSKLKPESTPHIMPLQSAPDKSAPPQANEENNVRATALLTEKEREVLSLLVKSMTNKEIARVMDVSEETVKWHLKNLFSKVNAFNRKHAVARAKLIGLID